MVTLEQAKEYLESRELPFPILFFRLSSTGLTAYRSVSMRIIRHQSRC